VHSQNPALDALALVGAEKLAPPIADLLLQTTSRWPNKQSRRSDLLCIVSVGLTRWPQHGRASTGTERKSPRGNGYTAANDQLQISLARNQNASKTVEINLGRGAFNRDCRQLVVFPRRTRCAHYRSVARTWSGYGEGLAKARAVVTLNGRNVDTLEAVVRTLSRGLKAETSLFDVTDHRAAQAAIDAIVTRHGRLDILIANVGINHPVPLDDWTPADWDRILGTNLKACFFSLNKQPYQCVSKGMGEHVECKHFWQEAQSTVMPLLRADLSALLVPLPANLRVRNYVQRHMPWLFRN
jgi:short chain dehydrogenase